MTDQEKRRRQTRNFLIFCGLLYVAIAYITSHVHHVIELSGKPFDIQNVDVKQLTEASKASMINNIFVFPSEKTLQILSFELITVFIFALYKITTQKNLMPGKEHGTAKWGGNTDRSRIRNNKDQFANVILTETERLSLDTKKVKKNLNLLVIGGAGTGKSRFVVKPNILQANTSFVITDPKGELLRDTGHSLEQQGYKVKVFNLIDMSQSCRYNPFAYVKKESDILKVINNLIKNTNGNKNGASDPFWESAERALLQAIFLYIFYELPEFEHRFATVFTMLRLAEVKEDEEDFKSEFDFLFEMLREDNPNHIAVKQYDIFKMASGKTAKSILISAGVRLSPFGIEEVERLLSDDDLELQALGDEKTALFVLIPDSDSTFNFLVAMMYAQLFDSLYYQADFVSGGSLKYHVKFWLDEFANIGQIPEFDKLIATMRSRNISVAPIIQNMTQLKSLYKETYETIIGNCDTILFLGGQERSTLEWVNKGLDKQTIDTKNTSQSRGRNSSSSISYGSQGRDLMTISELARMPDHKCVLFVRGLDPFYSDKYKLESHPNYKLLYEANENNYFDSSMGWKQSSSNSDLISELVNMRVPEQELAERMDELSIVNVDELDILEKQMDELI
ncbi:VirD4-like conjugal transfer protein, CD1115 family [Paenibacillus xylanilyticus]|uniref:Type IV secretory system conjugative DNA transfer family protein n=1 Tax=Paenibacillus xylanilyticus TaxID=248903 RepID=A0A7Y6BVR6_9BACL|nr:type IV secretory system conjugative DNA transfer family protein [Paenibacillus xylanilyticus]NUU75346.1 type IV secretory system conjugative DNA transfer family protein [Paenibacillus xylanilyticus]